MKFFMQFFSKSDREAQMKNMCSLDENAIHCSSNPNFCIVNWQSCNGVANCPNAEDELLANCSSKFSPLATTECLKKDIYNVNITIKAVNCNGIVECQSGVDEENCELPDFYSVILMFFLVLFTTFLASSMWKWTIKDLKPIDHQNLTFNQDNFEIQHGSESLKILMHQAQNSKNSKIINQHFIQMEMKHHDGVCSEIICCIKVSLTSQTFYHSLNVFLEQFGFINCCKSHECFTFRRRINLWKDGKNFKESNLLRQVSVRKKKIYEKSNLIEILIRIEKLLEKLTMFRLIKTSVSHSMDFIKDSLILVQLDWSQGGFRQIMTHPTPYIQGVSKT